MGKQIGFFQTDKDMMYFVAFIKENGMIIFDNLHKEIVDFDYEKMTKEYGQYYIGYSNSILIPYSIKDSKPFGIKWESETVELTIQGAIKEKNSYMPSRIWIYQTNYQEGNERIYKAYKTFASYIKRKYKYYAFSSGALGYYLASDFLEKLNNEEIAVCQDEKTFLKINCDNLEISRKEE